MELFQRVKMWLINLLYPSLPYPDIPDHCFSNKDSLETYREIVLHLFGEKNTNAGRIEILSHFTKKLSQSIPRCSLRYSMSFQRCH